MNKAELINLTDKAMKRSSYNMDDFKEKTMKLKSKLNKIIKAISTLTYENQRIICYRYFESLTYKMISLRVGISSSTVRRRVEFSLLSIGRVLFGMEDEFWKEIDRIQK